MSDIPEEPFDIEAERFLVQLRLALKLLTFDWEANLELLATKLQELCQKYLKHIETVKSKQKNVSVVGAGSALEPTIEATSINGANGVAKQKLGGLVAPDTPNDNNEGSEAEISSESFMSQADSGDAQTNDTSNNGDMDDKSSATRAQIYDEALLEESCHLIISHPEFRDIKQNDGYKTWIDENLIGIIDLALKNKTASPKDDTEPDNTEAYGGFTFVSRHDVASEPKTPQIYIRFENLTNRSPLIEDIQDIMRSTLYTSTITMAKFPGLVGMELVPIPNTEFQAAWDREILAEWYRGAALLWDGEPYVEGSAAKGGAAAGSPVAGVTGNLLGALPLASVAKSAAAITDVSTITGIATNIVKSDGGTKKESTIEAKVETKDEDGTERTVQAKVEVKISEVPDTAEGSRSTTPTEIDMMEAGPSTSAIAAAVEAAVDDGPEDLKVTILESTAAIQHSEAALLESSVALAETQSSLVESAVAIGKTEAALANSTAAVSKVVESKAALVTSALDLGKSKDSLIKSAIALGKSKFSLLVSVLRFGDKVGEAFGVDLIDDKLFGDGGDESGKLTGWAKVKSEIPCPFDYPPDKDFKLKYTRSIDDCLPSLASADHTLSRLIEIHSPNSAAPFEVKSLAGRYILNTFQIATHRILITYICSENVIRYVTGIEADPARVSMMSSGLDGVEKVLGFMGPNPAAMAAAGVLKAGRSMAEQKKKDAAAEFQKKSTILLRKLWFLTTEVYAFLWFTKPQTGGKYEFDTAFHRASWNLIRENRAVIYAGEETPRITTDVSEDYFIYLQEQTLMLREYSTELELQAKDLMEGLEKVL